MRGGRKLNPLMPAVHYAGQTGADLDAMFAYLRTVTPVRHFVDWKAQPTLCRVCNKEHGGGERN
jgi:hypothetical protein